MTDIALPILDYGTLAVQTAFVFFVFVAIGAWVWVLADDFDAWTTRLYRVVFPPTLQWDTEQCGWCERYQHLGSDSVCVVTRYKSGNAIAVTHVRVCGACARDLQLTRERVA